MPYGEQDAFSLIGVEPGSSPDEVEKAYRTLAQIYHPDRYEGAPNEVRLEAEQRMAQLNAARDAIRAGYQRPTDGDPMEAENLRRAQSAAHNYSGPYCVICGHAPVADLRFKACLGRVLWRRVRTWNGSLCRACGEAVYRDMQNETMTKGWWGAISFLGNFGAILGNWAQHRRLMKLGPPTATPKTPFAAVPVPLLTGRKLRQRIGPWLSIAIVAVVGLIAFGSAWSQSSTSSTDATPSASADASSVGACSAWNKLNADVGNNVATDYEYRLTFSLLVAAGDSDLRQAGAAAVSAAKLNDRVSLNDALSRIDSACRRVLGP
jgi:hypothetical protein